jgi:cobalt/nickel transport protein
MKISKKWLYLIGFIILIALMAAPFLLKPGAKFDGSDDQGSQTIEQVSPGYTPWFTWFWQPPPETESFLFAVQAAIGAIVIGYFIGYTKARREEE